MSATALPEAPASLAHRATTLGGHALPAVIAAQPGESFDDLIRSSRESLGELLLGTGAILFRGFPLRTPEQFRAASALFFEEQQKSYIGGVSPRGQVVAGVYESTRFPAHLRIPQHNEMSYLPEPPRHLAFFCEIPPTHQGETPLADSRRIYELIPEEVRSAFEQAGVSYHRYLYGPKWNIHHLTRNRFVKLHTSWMQAFSTTDPAAVERLCAETGSTVQWDREEGARISNVLPAVRRHPITGEMLWFNQVSTFLSSPKTLGWAKWLLYHAAYPNPLRRPMHARFGDGRPITLAQLDAVNDAIERATVRFPWQQGDLLVVDNFLVTHGRMPFRGDRRILVSIS